SSRTSSRRWKRAICRSTIRSPLTSVASACTAAARRRSNRPNCAYACWPIRPHPATASRSSPMPLEARLAHWRRRVGTGLETALDSLDAAPPRLRAAMRHAVLGGGKRLRPLLVYATGDAVGADEAVLDAPAVAIELVHAFSLVHDDLP